MSERYGDIWVCTDCYFAHHYGAHAMMRSDDGSLDGPLDPTELTYLRANSPHRIVWFAGESDEPCELEPLHLIGDDFQVFDNTCSNHLWRPDVDDDGLGFACQYCGQTGDEDGIQEFSMSSCDGCGSHLGGARFRLSMWKED